MSEYFGAIEAGTSTIRFCLYDTLFRQVEATTLPSQDVETTEPGFHE
jgi:hypothetical protein